MKIKIKKLISSKIKNKQRPDFSMKKNKTKKEERIMRFYNNTKATIKRHIKA